MTIPSYPLTWPPGWPRTDTAKRLSGPFKQTVHAALKNVEDEVRRLGGKITAISSNVTLGDQRPKDPGVAVYFDYDGEATAIPCDRWTSVESNLQAIAKTIEAMRGIERWGAKHMVKAAFRGWAQLAGPPAGFQWWAVLGVAREAAWPVIETAYKQQRKFKHPDHGGNGDDFHLVQTAYEAARVEKQH